MSHHQTYHKHEPEAEPEPINPQRIPLPTPSCLAPPALAQQLQPMLQYTNPQMTLLYGLTPPGFTQVPPLPIQPVNAQAKQSTSNSAQVEPLIQSKSAGKKPIPPPLHGSAFEPKPPGIQSTNAEKKPSQPLQGSALAPKPPGIQSMDAHKSINNSNKHTARFRYRPYPMPEKPMNEKPKHAIPPPFDLNGVYQGKPLSIERTGPPLLEARNENTPAGDGSLSLVSDARRGKRPVGDIPDSSSVAEFPGEKENLDLNLSL